MDVFLHVSQVESHCERIFFGLPGSLAVVASDSAWLCGSDEMENNDCVMCPPFATNLFRSQLGNLPATLRRDLNSG